LLAAQNALHISRADEGKSAEDVTQAALRAKEAADADYQKICDASSVATSRFCTQDTTTLA
jgi:hypothetical protein